MNVKTSKLSPRSSRRCSVWGSGRLPQGGEFPLPLPQWLGRRCGRRRCGHHRTPSRPSSARRRLRGTHRLSCRLPSGGRHRARPRRCLLCRLRGSGRGGESSHLSGRIRPPSLSSSSSSDHEYSEVVGEESPCCSRSRNSSLLCSRRSRRWNLFSFLRAARSCSRRCATRARARARGVGGSDPVASTAITCEGRMKLCVTTTPHESIDRRGAGIHSPKGRGGA
jgi:hypothetical protein